MRSAVWAVTRAISTQSSPIIGPSGDQLLLSLSVPGVSVLTAGGRLIRPASRDALLTTVAPNLQTGMVQPPSSVPLILTTTAPRVGQNLFFSPVAFQLTLTKYAIIPDTPWSPGFSSGFGPHGTAPVQGATIAPPTAQIILDSTVGSPSSPWSADFSNDFGPFTTVPQGGTPISPAADQLLLSLTAPIPFKRAPAAQLLFTRLAPGVRIGRTITPGRVDLLSSPTAPRVLPGRLIKPSSDDQLLTTTAPTATSAQLADYSGLNAWSAHTFVLGEQCLNQGLAYQCITAGVSTIAPTGTGANIVMGSDGAHFTYLGVATKTFNVHEALAAWTNHTFSLGERCSNAGNAYQCITGGTSTVAPTGTSADSAPGGTVHFKWLSAIDYTTPQAWSDFMNTTFSGPGLKYNPVVSIWNDGVYTRALNTPWLSYFGIAANGCNTTIAAAAGESFRDKVGTTLAFSTANGVAFQAATTGTETATILCYIDVANVTLDGLQLRNVNPIGDTTTTINILVGGNTNATSLTIRNCILDGRGLAYFVANNCKMINNLLVSRLATQPSTLWPCKWDLAITGGVFEGNTCIGVSGTGFQAMAVSLGAANQLIVRNNAFFGLNTPVLSQNQVGSCVIDHCCTDQTLAQLISPAAGVSSTDGGSQQISKTFANQFVSTTTDFHLKAGADCINAGVVDTTNNPVGDDIFGLARGATWDIGADEF